MRLFYAGLNTIKQRANSKYVNLDWFEYLDTKLNRVIGTIGEKIEISKAKMGNDHQEMVEMLRMLVPR